MAELKQSGRADTVSAAFIFLNLLKRQADGIAKFFLAEAEQRTTKAHTASDMDIHGIWNPGRKAPFTFLAVAGLGFF
jgi:hypothetical protein